MRYFQFIISSPSLEEDEVWIDHLVTLSETEVKGSYPFVELNKEYPDWDEEKVLKKWMQEEWVIEVSEKEYKKYLKEV